MDFLRRQKIFSRTPLLPQSKRLSLLPPYFSLWAGTKKSVLLCPLFSLSQLRKQLLCPRRACLCSFWRRLNYYLCSLMILDYHAAVSCWTPKTIAFSYYALYKVSRFHGFFLIGSRCSLAETAVLLGSLNTVSQVWRRDKKNFLSMSEVVKMLSQEFPQAGQSASYLGDIFASLPSCGPGSAGFCPLVLFKTLKRRENISSSRLCCSFLFVLARTTANAFGLSPEPSRHFIILHCSA